MLYTSRTLFVDS